MPSQEGNEESQSNQNEERKAGDPGRLSDLRHQDVQNRQELGFSNTKVF